VAEGQGISLGDAVLNFVGDTTNLEAAYDTVNTQAKTKLQPALDQTKGLGDQMKKTGTDAQQAGVQVSEAWIKVARATQENSAAQKQLSDAMAAVKATAGQDVVAMLALAQAQQRAAISSLELAAAQKEAAGGAQDLGFKMGEAKGTIALVGEEIGIKIPRHIRGFVAGLPGVGAALEAAFSGFAVLMLIQILAEGVKKLVEMHEAAEKLREEWTMQEGDFRHTSQGIQDEIDRQQAKFIEITQGPIAAYDFALRHLRSTAEETLTKITGEVEAAASKMESRGGMLAYIFGGQPSARAGEMGGKLKEFDAELQEIMRHAADSNKQDPFAGYNAGLDTVSKKIAEIQGEIDRAVAAANSRHDNSRFGDSKGIAADAIMDIASLQRTVTILEHVQDQLSHGKEADIERDKTNDAQKKQQAVEHEVQIGNARLDVQRGYQMAALQLMMADNQARLTAGKESYEQFLTVEKDAANKRYEVERNALEQKTALLQKDPVKNEAAIISNNGRIRELEMQHKLELLKIDQDAYKHQADAAVKAMDAIIATTRQGSQDRIDDEKQKLALLKEKFGEESDAYLAQLSKVNEAERAHADEQTKLNREERMGAEALANDKMQATLRYYQYLQSTARISAAELLVIQQKEEDSLYQRKRAGLEKQLKELGPEEVVARQKIVNELDLLDQQHEEARRLGAQQTEDILELSYQALGMKSSDMYGREVKNAQKAYDAIKHSGKSAYGELLQAQIKLTEASIAFGVSQGKNVQKEVKELDRLNKAYHQLQLTLGNLNKTGKLGETIMKTLGVDAQLMGSKVQNVALATTGALEMMFMAWAQGGVTVEQAAAQIAAAVLKSLAQYAFAKATEQLALGFAAMSPTSPDFGHSGEHFGSAALWFAAGAAASVVGGLVGGLGSKGSGSSSTSGAGGATSVTDSNSESTPQAPVNTVNVQHFAKGALITKRTMAVLGDSMSGGGDSTEAVLPLDHPESLRKIGQAIGAHIGGGGIHVTVQGLISPDNLGKVIKKIDRKVKTGQGKLTASNSYRVTKRSI
jgi:hypothetical protein